MRNYIISLLSFLGGVGFACGWWSAIVYHSDFWFYMMIFFSILGCILYGGLGGISAAEGDKEDQKSFIASILSFLGSGILVSFWCAAVRYTDGKALWGPLLITVIVLIIYGVVGYKNVKGE